MDGQRNRLSHERVRADQLDQKVSLAIARSRLRFAENEVHRQAALREEQIVAQFEYEAALDERDTLLAEVNERWLAAFESISEEYPYRVVRPRNDNFGIALLSRFEIQDAHVILSQAAAVPTGLPW